MSADTNEKTPGSNEGKTSDPVASIKSELDTKLSEVQKQLEAMNSTFAQSIQAMTAKPQPAVEEIDDSDVFDAKTLNKKVTQTADAIARELMAEERRKNATIYQMAQEYPEIHSDRDLQKEILSAQKALPKALQDTAEGYEMAVLKAVAKQGLVAKSRRAQSAPDDDFSVGGGSRGGSQAPTRSEKRSSRKVSDNTLIVAELLRGRELTDEERKGLEKATNRDAWNKFR